MGSKDVEMNVTGNVADKEACEKKTEKINSNIQIKERSLRQSKKIYDKLNINDESFSQSLHKSIKEEEEEEDDDVKIEHKKVKKNVKPFLKIKNTSSIRKIISKKFTPIDNHISQEKLKKEDSDNTTLKTEKIQNIDQKLAPTSPVISDSENSKTINKLGLKINIPKFIKKGTKEININNSNAVEQDNNVIKSVMSSLNDNKNKIFATNSLNHNFSNYYSNNQNLSLKKDYLYQNSAFSPLSPTNLFRTISPFQNSIETPNNKISFNFHNHNFYNTYLNNNKEPFINYQNLSTPTNIPNQTFFDNTALLDGTINNTNINQLLKTGDSSFVQWLSQVSPGNIGYTTYNANNNNFNYITNSKLLKNPQNYNTSENSNINLNTNKNNY